jgi:hypothetical protein
LYNLIVSYQIFQKFDNFDKIYKFASEAAYNLEILSSQVRNKIFCLKIQQQNRSNEIQITIGSISV